MFHSARWKAYLQKLQDDDAVDDGDGQHKVIYHIYHSQKIWFAVEHKNNHQDSAKENLKKSDALLRDCTTKVDALEKTLANTPKPSEVLDWGTLW